MSESNYSRLVAVKHELVRKASQSNFQVLGNKVNNLNQKSIALFNAHREGKLQTAHWSQLHAAFLSQQEVDSFRSIGLNDADIKSLEELVNINIRRDYTTLEELKGVATPGAYQMLKDELDAVLQENSTLGDRIEKLEMRSAMIEAAADMGPEALKVVKEVLNRIEKK